MISDEEPTPREHMLRFVSSELVKKKKQFVHLVIEYAVSEIRPARQNEFD